MVWGGHRWNPAAGPDGAQTMAQLVAPAIPSEAMTLKKAGSDWSGKERSAAIAEAD